MYIRKTTKKVKGKTYINYLLVESVQTPKGPRQKTICSLGNLKPRPKEEWLNLVRRVESALSGQQPLFEKEKDEEIEFIVARAKEFGEKKEVLAKKESEVDEEVISIYPDRVEVEKAREGGSVHVGHQFWKKLSLDDILKEIGFSDRARMLTEVMVMNRLIFPSSEHATPSWIKKTALSDILRVNFNTLGEDSLYRNLDKLYDHKELIEARLAEVEKTLFNLDDTIYLYDLTSTYFEGESLYNEQAKRGYSRDRRSDCKQVVVGLVINKDGYPVAHEVFDGNRTDKTTLDEMLDSIEKRVGKRDGRTVVVDRGMAYEPNIQTLKDRKYHYIVATRQQERSEWLDEFEEEEGFKEVIRKVSPTNRFQRKSKVEIKRVEKGEEVYILCLSEGRKEKDKAIRERQGRQLLRDSERLQLRIQKGYLKKPEKIHEAIGRIKERYPRVSRYYTIGYDSEGRSLLWKENGEKKEIAEKLDGGYLLKTDRKDMDDNEIWHVYSFLSRAEAAFLAMKSPLSERPIFHQLKHRVQTHIFLCVLAYHLLISIERMMLEGGIHTSWETMRKTLSTHQVVTVVLPTTSGAILRIRRASKPEKEHMEIYKKLRINSEIIKPIKRWSNVYKIVTENFPKSLE